MDKRIGHYSFIAAVVLSIVLGLASEALPKTTNMWLASILIILGLVAGYININNKELKDFMTVATVLIIAAYVGRGSDLLLNVEVIGKYIWGIFNSLMAFIVAAMLAVTLKKLWSICQNQ